MSTIYNPSIVTNGLILCVDASNLKSYPGSGTTWFDLMANGGNVPIGRIGTTTFDSANPKGFICTSGFNGKVTSASDPLDLQSQVSLGVWVKPTGTAFSTGSFYYILGKNLASGYGDHQYALNVGNTQNLEFQIGASTLSTPYTWTTDAWYYITATWNGSSISTYINGVLQGSIAATSTTFKPNFSISGRSTSSDFTTGIYPFPGSIALVTIYNQALTSNQILQNFNALRGRYSI